MEFRLKALKHVDVIAPSGRLEGPAVDQFERVIAGLHDRNRRKLVIDCTRLEYVNSAGLRVLLSALKDCKKAGGNVVMAHVQPRVADTLQLVGFQTLFEQYPDVLDAVDSF